MNTPFKIEVTPYLVNASRSPDSLVPRTRYRWRAELIEVGVGSRGAVEGHETPDAAIGALVRWCAGDATSPDDVLDFLASLFDDPRHHAADFSIGRAIRLAVRNPRRQRPGCEVVIGDPADAKLEPVAAKPAAKAKPASARAVTVKGGAL